MSQEGLKFAPDSHTGLMYTFVIIHHNKAVIEMIVYQRIEMRKWLNAMVMTPRNIVVVTSNFFVYCYFH